MEVLDIGAVLLVQDHKIDKQLFEPPILDRLQGFTNQALMLAVGYAHQHDRQVA